MAKSAIITKKVPYVRTVCEFDEGGIDGEIHFISEHGSRVWKIDEFSEDNKRHAFVAGIRSKGADLYAAYASDWDAVIQSLDGMETRLRYSTWNTGRSESFGGTTDLFQAVVNINKTPITFDEVTAVYEAYTKDERRTLRGRDDVQAEMLEIKARRARAKINDDTESIDIRV